ncbi:MAG: site-2 protease family protein [Myxococcota bacterium]
MKGLEPFVWLLVFVISVTAHEAAHALAAYLGGDETAYLGGQVTLNPLPHMRREPFGMVLMPLLGVLMNGFPIGWASTPFDPDWERRYPRRAAWMAFAGPATNFALALAALLFMRVGLKLRFFFVPELQKLTHLVAGNVAWIDGMGRFTSMMLVLNSMLCLLNLIPFPPLDGASVITLLLPEQVGLRLRQALRQPALALIGMLAIWYGFWIVFRPVLREIVRLVHG